MNKKTIGAIIKTGMFLIVVIPTIYLCLYSQSNTKMFGGETVIDLPAGIKLVPYTVQWEPDNSNFWYLTEEAEPGYQPRVYEFRESSTLGIMSGKIIIQEH